MSIVIALPELVCKRCQHTVLPLLTPKHQPPNFRRKQSRESIPLRP